MHRKKFINNVLIILLFLILSFFSVFLLLRTKILFGAGDMQFHLKRILELEQNVKHGSLFNVMSFNYFHGSLVMNLYPYINLLPIIFLSLFIKSNIYLIYIFFALNVFVALTASYFGSINVSKSKIVSFIFSIVYSLSTPFLTYGFYNMDLGVVTSIAVLPLVIFGFINILKYHTYIEFVIGLSFVIFSHVITTIIIISFLIVLCIINLKRINRCNLLILIKSIILVGLITAVVWIPAFYFGFLNINNMYPPAPGHMIGSKLSVLIRNALFDNISYGLNIFALIGIFVPLIFYKSFYKKLDRYIKQMYWFSVLIIFVCSNIFPWRITNYSVFKVFMLFQFPWRFYIIPELLLSYIFSIFIVNCIHTTNIKFVFSILILFIMIGLNFIGQDKIINESIKSPSFNYHYIMNNTYYRKNTVDHKNINLKDVHFKYFKSPEYPYYKVNNECQINNLANTNTDECSPDYYPIKSLSKLNYINNSKGVYRDKIIDINHIGFNKFGFNNKWYIYKLHLPLLGYNGEQFHLYLNHHLIRYHYDRNNMITINHIRKGSHVLKIKYIPNIWIMILKYSSFIIGILILFLLILKKY